MIVRILGEGQFRTNDKLLDSLNKIDNEIVNHVSKGDRVEFRKDLAKFISIIKKEGEPLDPVEILPSDIIIPPGDLSLDEARHVFSGHGLIKD
jgi:3',5'-cyclic AMP phosphodiesterase CpdA